MKNIKGKSQNLIALIASMLLIPTATVFAEINKTAEEAANFSDITESNIYYESINYVKSQGIVKGYDDKTYKPENKINRAEFTKIIIEATKDQSEINNCTPTKNFSDISTTDWYEKYVCVAANNKIINGYDDGTFKGENNIDFVEASKIIVNAFDLKYTEGEQWYEGYVKALEEKNTSQQK